MHAHVTICDHLGTHILSLTHGPTFSVFAVGDRYMTATVHSLLHLPQSVLYLGPLWSHSCFPFEAANGDLLKLFHGSQGIEKQVK